MRLRLWYFINKHAILKKLFYWIFPLLGINVANAEVIYQCNPCPSGQSSNPGAIGAGACFNPKTKGAASTIFNGTGNQSGTLQPGWYRISLRGANGSGTGWKTGDTYCTQYKDGDTCKTYGDKPCKSEKYVCPSGKTAASSAWSSWYCPDNSGTPTKKCDKWGDAPCLAYNQVCASSATGSSCQGNGGTGGSTYYVFYVTSPASYSFTYNGGSPKLTVTESGRSTRTFYANAGGNGSASKSGVNWSCSNGGNGSAGASGIFSPEGSSSNVDSFGSVGGKLTKL